VKGTGRGQVTGRGIKKSSDTSGVKVGLALVGWPVQGARLAGGTAPLSSRIDPGVEFKADLGARLRPRTQPPRPNGGRNSPDPAEGDRRGKEGDRAEGRKRGEKERRGKEGGKRGKAFLGTQKAAGRIRCGDQNLTRGERARPKPAASEGIGQWGKKEADMWDASR